MQHPVETLVHWIRSYGPCYAIVMIGNSGSGKSTMATNLSSSLWTPIVSSDLIRSQFSSKGDDTDQSVNHLVWPEVYRQVGYNLQCGDKRVIVDATHAKSTERQKMVAFIREHGSIVLGIWMDTPLEQCEDHNNARHNPRPPGALVVMNQYLWKRRTDNDGVVSTPPAIADGFDGLWRVDYNDWK